jgi:long-subunit acyl-CoA synthetase (AMP-forming)
VLSIEERCHLFKLIDSIHISAITDLVTGTYYSSEDFKNEIKKRITYFLENFEVSKNAPVLILESNSANFFINFFCFYFLEIPIVPFNEQASKFEIENVINYIKLSHKICK